MATPRSTMGHVAVSVGVLVLGVLGVLSLAACDDGPSRGFALPSAPTPPPTAGAPPAPAPTPVPLPTRFGPLVYTPLEIGVVVRGPLVDPPECVDERGWPCKYFLLTPPVSGRLDAVLTYSQATQGGQGVDLTVRDVDNGTEVWAQTFRPDLTGVEASVREGRTYHLVMRYAFDGLEFELATSLKPE